MSREAWGDEGDCVLPEGCVAEETYDELVAECQAWQDACAKMYRALHWWVGGKRTFDFEPPWLREAMDEGAEALRQHTPRHADGDFADDEERPWLRAAAMLADRHSP